MTTAAQPKNIHDISEFLDLSFDRLLSEPVIVDEEIFQQFIAQLPAAAVGEEEFLHLSFESLFQVRLDPFIKDKEEDEEEKETDQSMIRAGSSFAETELIPELTIAELLSEPVIIETEEQDLEKEETEEEDIEEIIVEEIDVNDPPVAVADVFGLAEESGLFHVPAPGVLSNDQDSDVGDLKFVVAVNGDNAAVGEIISLDTGALLRVNQDGSFTYDPNDQFEFLSEGQIESDGFDYIMADSEGLSSMSDVRIKILGENDDPIANDDNESTQPGEFITDEDTDFVTGNVLLNDEDIDFNDTIRIFSVDDSNTKGEVSILADDVFVYDPNGKFERMFDGEVDFDTFTYTVTDELGVSNSATVTITIEGACEDSVQTFLDHTSAGSLRDLIFCANEHRPGTDVIQLQAGTYVLSIPGMDEDAGMTGDLDILENLIIKGDPNGGTIIDANGIDRVFDLVSGDLTLENLTIQGGDAGAFFGGGILSRGQILELYNVTLIDNMASTGAGIYLQSGSELWMRDSTLSQNIADGNGGAVYNEDGRVVIENSTLSENEAGDAGGLGVGAGLFNRNGDVTIINSTISSNRNNSTGTGIWNTGDLLISNSTITNNDGGAGSNGIGIHTDNWFGIPGGSLGKTFLISTIVAGNENDRDLEGVDNFFSGGHNLIGSTVGTIGFVLQASDIVGVAPELAPLDDNGGPTQTHALLPTSPAIDAGDTDGLSSDQRGWDFVAPEADIGSYEFGAVAPVVPPVVLDLDGDGIELVSPYDSGIYVSVFDPMALTQFYEIGWVGPDDGILVYDLNQDGVVTSLQEFVLSGYHEAAQTDLEGLAMAFDTNQDGVFDISDEHYIEFGVWQDANQDGLTDLGEFHSLEALQISSIDLQSESHEAQILEGNILYGKTHYTLYDGTQLEIGDVGLGVGSKVDPFVLFDSDVLMDDNALSILLETGLGDSHTTSDTAMVYEEASAVPIAEVSEVVHQIEEMSHEVFEL